MLNWQRGFIAKLSFILSTKEKCELYSHNANKFVVKSFMQSLCDLLNQSSKYAEFMVCRLLISTKCLAYIPHNNSF